jgi:uncharacterized protein DUF3305
MIERPTRMLAVILERTEVHSRWETHRWELRAVVPDAGGEPRTLLETPSLLQRIYPGLPATLFVDEAEGYHLNVTTAEPSVFVALRTPEEGGEPRPFQLTLSYNEAARWMDGGEVVERTPMWEELAEWVAAFAEQHYRPESKKRQRPRSFDGQGELREKKFT